MAYLRLACLAAASCAAAVVTAQHPIPNVTNSLCYNSTDYQADAKGAPVGSNFSYRVCMDVASASTRMECTDGVPCPGGPDVAMSVYTGGISYTVDHSGTCTAKPCGQPCAPPYGLPFSFLVIDGAGGNTARGVAKWVGTAEIDGQTMDHFSHDRGTVVPGMGVMNWYLVGNDLMRNSYIQPATFAPNPGGSGNRDFSVARVEPAPAASFAVPKGCPPPARHTAASETALWPAQDNAFGDR